MIPLAAHIVTDTIAVDTTTLRRFATDEMYNYDRELLNVESDDWGLLEAISRWIERTFGHSVDIATDDSTAWIWATIGIVVFVLGLFLLFRNRKWFLTGKKDKEDIAYTVEEDNIYGIDFESEIAAARDKGNYREAVRLVYLSTLRRLSDAERLSWLPQKTPSQYVREVNDARFKTLSDEYIRVRFGGREATDTTVSALLALRDDVAPAVTEGGERK